MSLSLFGIFRSFLTRFRRRPKSWPALPMGQIRKRARILVIDDQDFPYISLLKADGYTVDKWDDVKDLSKLEEGYYDLILLDIHDVATDRSHDAGLGILRHLKQVAPAQIVIAYSAADFSLRFKQFFDQADAALAKTADYVDFKSVIDELLNKRFSLDFYVGRIIDVADSHQLDTEELRNAARDAILRRDEGILYTFLANADSETDRTERALQIAQTAIGILQLLATA